MPKNSRRKGAQGERLAAAYLASLGFPARRGQQFRGGGDSPDVICDLAIHLEVKRVETMDVGTKLLDDACIQAARDASGKPWAVLWRRNRGAWRLTYELPEPWSTVTVSGDDDIRRALLWLHGRSQEVA
jgi:hypothetical protein